MAWSRRGPRLDGPVRQEGGRGASGTLGASKRWRSSGPAVWISRPSWPSHLLPARNSEEFFRPSHDALQPVFLDSQAIRIKWTHGFPARR